MDSFKYSKAEENKFLKRNWKKRKIINTTFKLEFYTKHKLHYRGVRVTHDPL